MSETVLGLTTLACVLGGILMGVLLRNALPDHHLSGDTKDVVRLGTGLIGTLAALVLGLLIGNAKSSYDTQTAQVKQFTANIVLLDYLLAEYGDDARPLRELMRHGIGATVDRIWRQRGSRPAAPFEATQEGEALFLGVQRLSPKNDMQRSLHARAVQTVGDLAQTRLALFTQQSDPIPIPFLAVLLFWLTCIFMSFSLFAQPSPMVIGALVLFALSATGAIYLVSELGDPFSGIMQISSGPLRNALRPLGS
jgi:hypothetical protein